MARCHMEENGVIRKGEIMPVWLGVIWKRMVS